MPILTLDTSSYDELTELNPNLRLEKSGKKLLITQTSSISGRWNSFNSNPCKDSIAMDIGAQLIILNAAAPLVGGNKVGKVGDSSTEFLLPAIDSFRKPDIWWMR